MNPQDTPLIEPEIVVQDERDTLIKTLQTDVRDLKYNIDTISDHLINEAEDRGWCDEYDTIVDSLNGCLRPIYKVREREQDYAISFTICATAKYVGELEAAIDKIGTEIEDWEIDRR
jgi:hypothetical protein